MAKGSTAIVSFNPTAKAIQYTGDNLQEVLALTGTIGINDLPELKDNTYVVLFMGQVTLMGEEGYRSAMGLI